MKRSCKILYQNSLRSAPTAPTLPWKRKPPQRTKNKRGNQARASFSHKGTKVHLRAWRGCRQERKREKKSETEMRKGRRENKVFYPTTRGYLFGKQTDRWTDNDAHRSMDKSVYCVNTRTGPDPGAASRTKQSKPRDKRGGGEKRKIREAPFAQHPSLSIARINQAAREPLLHSSYQFLYSDVLSAKRFHGGDKIHVNRKSNRRKVARNVPKCVRATRFACFPWDLISIESISICVAQYFLESQKISWTINERYIVDIPNIRFIEVCRKSI